MQRLASLMLGTGILVATPITQEGTVVRWGQTSVPRNWSGYVALAEGLDGGGIGVRNNGTLANLGFDGIAYPWEPYSELETLTEVVHAARGSAGGVALLRDGRIVPWGTYAPAQENRFYRQFGPVTKVVAVAVGMSHAVALRSDGTAVCAGENTFGQCSPPEAATNLVQVAAGDGLSIGLRADGTLIAWGVGWFGNQDFPPGFSDVVEISASRWHTYARLRDGRVRIFGDDIPGGHFWPGVTNGVALAAGAESSYVILDDGTVRSRGRWPAPAWLHGVRTLLPGTLGAAAQVTVPVLTSDAGEPLEGLLTLPANSRITLKAQYPAGPAVEYRWLRNGRELPGQTGPELVVTGTENGDSGTYSVSVPQLDQDRVSQSVRIVFGIPVIVSHPASLQEPAGANLVLRAEVAAGNPVTYAWFVDGEPLESWNARTGAFGNVLPPPGPELRLENAHPAMSGRYHLVASTEFGRVTSAEAWVRIGTPLQDTAAQTGGGSVQPLRGDGGVRELGQTFTASVSGSLERVRLAGCAEAAGEFPTTLELRDVVEDRPGSRVFCRMERATLGCGPIEFVAADRVFLEADHAYALVIAHSAPAQPPRFCQFDASAADAYPSGRLWIRSGAETPWTPATGSGTAASDLVFAVQVTPGTPPLRIAGIAPDAGVSPGEPVELEVIAAPDLTLFDSVELYAGTTHIGTVPSPPFRFLWTPDSDGGPVDLRAIAASPAGGVQSLPLQVRVRGPGPDNDDLARARPLDGERTSVAFSLTGATREPFEPEIAEWAQGQSAWWVWTAPRSGVLRVQVDAGFTAPVAVFEGTRTPGMARRGAGAGLCDVQVEAGHSYRIGVDAPGFGAWAGTLRLMLHDFVIESPRAGTLLLPTQSATFTTSPPGSRPLKEMALWSDGGVIRRWTAPPFVVPATVLGPGAHRVWLEALDVDNTATRSPDLDLTVKPVNDFLRNATMVTGTRVEIEATNAGCESINPGSPFPSDPKYADNQGTHSLWYQWTAPKEGLVRLRGEGLPRGVLIGVYLPVTTGQVRQVNVNAFLPAGDPIYFQAVPGQTYLIMVDGLFQDQGWLRWSLEWMPPNDLFDTREGISQSTATRTFPQAPASLEYGEASMAPAGSTGSRWWIWRAPQSCRVIFRASSTGSPVSTGAFIGEKFRFLQPVAPAGPLGGTSETRFFAEAGKIYSLALFGSAPWTGEARIELDVDTVRLLHPAPSATLPWGSEIALTAAFELEGETADELEFFANSERVGFRPEPPWSVLWKPASPGSYTLRVVARAASGTVYSSEPVRTFVHAGEDVPAPRLVSAPESNGTLVVDEFGNAHLMGLTRGLFGVTNPPIAGLPEAAPWPPGVSRWTDIAISGGQTGGSGPPWMGAIDPAGNLYVSPTNRVPFPTGVRRFLKLCRGWNSLFAIGDDGQAYLYGVTRFESAATRPWRHLSHGYGFSAGLDDRGVLVLFTQGTFGEQVLQEAEFPAGVSAWERIEVSPNAIIAMDQAHHLYEIPNGASFGSASTQRKLVRPDGGSDWADVSIGGTVGLALAPDGRLFSWGSNNEGQLGNTGPSTSVANLREVTMPAGVTAWTAFVTGHAHGMAVGNDGELYGWGWNEGGLGIPPGAILFQPKKVESLPEITGPPRVFIRNTGGLPELAIPTLPKRSYRIQVGEGGSPWETLPAPVTGTGATVLWKDLTPAGTTPRLYRVERLP